MLFGEHIASRDKSRLLRGRKKDGNWKFLQHTFLSLCYCVLIVLDGERRRLRVWGLRQKKRMELFELQEGFPSVPAKLVNGVCALFSFTSLSSSGPPASLPAGHHLAPHLCLWSLTSLYELPFSLLDRMPRRGILLWPSVPEV